MYITNKKRLEERGFKVAEFMGILKHRMIFANNLDENVEISESEEVDIEEINNEFHWHKEKVLVGLEESAKEEGANALLDVTYWFSKARNRYLIVYGSAIYAKIEKKERL